MPLISRRTATKSVEVKNAEGEILRATIRALRASEEEWIQNRHVDTGDSSFDAESWRVTQLASFARDYVRLGLQEVLDQTDPDTGQPFKVNKRVVKVGDRSVEVATDNSLDAIAPWINGLCTEIMDATHLTEKEKEGVGFTSDSAEQPASRSAEPATGTSSTAPSTASASESSSAE